MPTGEANVFPGEGRLGGIACADAFRFFLGGLARACGRADGLLGALGQLLQAVSERLVRADHDRLELRQPDGGNPRRRRGRSAAHRVPHPGSRREPLRRLGGDSRRGTRRDRRAHRAAASLSGRRLCGQGAAEGAGESARGDRPSRVEPRWRRRRSAKTSSTTTSTFCGPSSASSTRSSRAGNGSAFSREA